MTNSSCPLADAGFMEGKPNKRNQPSQRKHRYKHVQSKPISLAKLGETSFKRPEDEESKHLEDEKSLKSTARSHKRKQAHTIGDLSLKTDEHNNWDKKTALMQITTLREKEKSTVIENFVKNHKSMEKDLEVKPGEPAFLSVLVSNSSKRSDVYYCKIDDPDIEHTKHSELSLVHNIDYEWQYWHEHGKCTDPPKWDMVDDSGNIYLEGNEQCPLLLKFFSYREPITTGAGGKKITFNDPLLLSPRKIYAKIYQQSDN